MKEEMIDVIVFFVFFYQLLPIWAGAVVNAMNVCINN